MKKARCAVISIGNKIKSDDDIANLILEKIPGNPGVLKIFGGINPENYIKRVKEFNPDIIFFMDALDSGDKPGNVKLLGINQVKTLNPSTHNIPLDMFRGFFPESEILVIGIQPKNLDFGTGLSPELEKKFREILEKVKGILSDH